MNNLKKTAFRVGDEVKYNAKFVKQVQLPYDEANMKGKITQLKTEGSRATWRAVINWDDGTSSTSLLSYLKHTGNFEPFE